jgi:hypothetical protein
MPRFGLLFVVAYGALLGPVMILVSIWLPISSVSSACYCLDRRCVLNSLVTSAYDRTISSASTINPMYACLLRATGTVLCKKRRKLAKGSGARSDLYIIGVRTNIKTKGVLSQKNGNVTLLTGWLMAGRESFLREIETRDGKGKLVWHVSIVLIVSTWMRTRQQA